MRLYFSPSTGGGWGEARLPRRGFAHCRLPTAFHLCPLPFALCPFNNTDQ
jgi:hypothetical protein